MRVMRLAPKAFGAGGLPWTKPVSGFVSQKPLAGFGLRRGFRLGSRERLD